MSPYSATTNIKPEQLKGLQWRRVVVFSLLIFAAVTMVAFLSGLTIARWQIYGATMEEAVINARLVRRMAYGGVAALLYWRLAAPLATRRWLHVLLAFACVQVLDIVVSFTLFQSPASELIEAGPLGRAALAALVGWGLASLDSARASYRT